MGKKKYQPKALIAEYDQISVSDDTKSAFILLGDLRNKCRHYAIFMPDQIAGFGYGIDLFGISAFILLGDLRNMGRHYAILLEKFAQKAY